MIEKALKHYEVALLLAFPKGASGEVFEHWNKARQAIAEAEGISLMPIKHHVGPKWDGDINPDSLEEIEIDLPKREWVGLTDEEIHNTEGYQEDRALFRFAQAIEAKLRSKNT